MIHDRRFITDNATAIGRHNSGGQQRFEDGKSSQAEQGKNFLTPFTDHISGLFNLNLQLLNSSTFVLRKGSNKIVSSLRTCSTS